MNQYESDTLFFPFPYLENGDVVFHAEIVSANGTTDAGSANNIYNHAFLYSHSSEPVTFEFGYDYYTSEIHWELVNSNAPSSILYSKNYITDGVTSPYILKDCFPIGCYQLTLHDTYGDGWSGNDHPAGYLKITNRNGEVIGGFDTQHANFGLDTTIEFCLQDLGIDETEKSDFPNFIIYPNPTKNHFTVQSNATVPIQSIRIFSTEGKLILTFNQPKPASQWNVQTHLTNGIYLVEVEFINRKSERSLLLVK